MIEIFKEKKFQFACKDKIYKFECDDPDDAEDWVDVLKQEAKRLFTKCSVVLETQCEIKQKKKIIKDYFCYLDMFHL